MASALGEGVAYREGGNPLLRRSTHCRYPSYRRGSLGLAALPYPFRPYIASLYEALKKAHPLISIVGFADDTNLMAFGQSPEVNVRQLEAA